MGIEFAKEVGFKLDKLAIWENVNSQPDVSTYKGSLPEKRVLRLAPNKRLLGLKLGLQENSLICAEDGGWSVQV